MHNPVFETAGTAAPQAIRTRRAQEGVFPPSRHACGRRHGLRSAATAGLLVMAALLAASCRPTRLTAVADTDPAGWSERVELELRSADTSARYDLGLFLRIAAEHTPGDSLSLCATFLSPDSLCYRDTLRTVLPALCIPASLAREVRIPMLRSVRVRREGPYRILIAPLHPVKGLEAVGIDLEQKQ